MSEYSLTAVPALGGHDQDHGGTRLRELTDLTILSIALPLGREATAEAAIATALAVDIPAIGRTTTNTDSRLRLARLGRDQLFVFGHDPAPDAAARIAARLDGAGYVTDQSDVWTGLEMTGPDTRAALARICPLDLHPDVFPVGQIARTAMEHLGVLITCLGADAFLLCSASSSADSFLHALQTSIRNLR